MGRVDGKVAIVTGAASGIGAGAAVALAEQGAAVVLTDLNDPAGETLAREITEKGGKAAYYHQDVAEEEVWPEIVSAAESTFGALKILVNNAGIAIGGSITDFSLEDWRRQNAVNLDGVFLGTRAAVRAMRETGGGSIINISSVAGLKGSPGLSGYCASKGGVRLFSKAVAVECGRAGYGVRVNSIHPGIIDTAIWQADVMQLRQTDDELAQRVFGLEEGANRVDIDQIAAVAAPLGFTGLPLDIAEGIVYLASDESRYVTGTELVIDGGLCA